MHCVLVYALVVKLYLLQSWVSEVPSQLIKKFLTTWKVKIYGVLIVSSMFIFLSGHLLRYLTGSNETSDTCVANCNVHLRFCLLYILLNAFIQH